MKLTHEGSTKSVLGNGIQVAIAPRESPPFPVDVMVFEEDTNLILTVDPVIEHEEEHIIRTMTDIMTAKKHKPGSVVVNGNNWYAVVIDLDRELICRESWCKEAVDQIFELTVRNDICSIAVPLLGTKYGKLQFEKPLQYIIERISSIQPCCLEYLWLVVSCDEIKKTAKRVKMF